MKTIEIDDHTASALKRRAEERGLSVSELIAELAAREAGALEVETGRSRSLIAAGRPLERNPRSLPARTS